MNVITAIEVLQKEINWCLDNPDKDLNHDQQMGFVNGLKQAQIILHHLTKRAPDARESDAKIVLSKSKRSAKSARG